MFAASPQWNTLMSVISRQNSGSVVRYGDCSREKRTQQFAHSDLENVRRPLAKFFFSPFFSPTWPLLLQTKADGFMPWREKVQHARLLRVTEWTAPPCLAPPTPPIETTTQSRPSLHGVWHNLHLLPGVSMPFEAASVASCNMVEMKESTAISSHKKDV